MVEESASVDEVEEAAVGYAGTVLNLKLNKTKYINTFSFFDS